MKTLFLHLTAIASLFLYSCKKTNDFVEVDKQTEPTKLVNQIPPQILRSLIADYIKKNDLAKVSRLTGLYDTLTGNKIEPIDAPSTERSVPGVGALVLDGGAFYEIDGNTSQHVQGLGWSNLHFNDMNEENVPVPYAPVPDAYDNTPPPVGRYVGTVGQGRRLEAFTLPYVQYKIENGGTTYGTDFIRFQYSSHVSGLGWMSSVMSPNVSGTVGQGRQIEAIKVKAIQNTTVLYNSSCLCIYTVKVFYRAHVSGIGWQNWVSADNVAGTVGAGRKLEAFQLRTYFVLE